MKRIVIKIPWFDLWIKFVRRYKEISTKRFWRKHKSLKQVNDILKEANYRYYFK